MYIIRFSAVLVGNSSPTSTMLSQMDSQELTQMLSHELAHTPSWIRADFNGWLAERVIE
jgi:hypothetical protein